MVHPVPPAIPLRTQGKLQARAAQHGLSVGSRKQVQRHFPVSPPPYPSGPRHWNGEASPLLCPSAEQPSGQCYQRRRAVPQALPPGKGHGRALFRAEAPTPGRHSLFPSLCNVSENRRGTESPDIARPARLLPAIQRAPSWEPGEGSTAHRGYPIPPRQGCGVLPARTHTPGWSPAAAIPPFFPGDTGGSP